MNLIFVFIILISLVISFVYCIYSKNESRKVIFHAFLINAALLGGSAIILYKTNIELFHKKSYGLFDSLGIVTLLFFIPILTWINIIVVRFNKK